MLIELKPYEDSSFKIQLINRIKSQACVVCGGNRQNLTTGIKGDRSTDYGVNTVMPKLLALILQVRKKSPAIILAPHTCANCRTHGTSTKGHRIIYGLFQKIEDRL